MTRFFSLLLLLVLLTGCHTWTRTGRYIKSQWEPVREYVDPEAEIDTDAYRLDDPNFEKLARLITPVDAPLLQLTRFIADRDTVPDDEWFSLLMARFPWLDRAFYTDAEGNILDQRPAVPLKRFSKPLVFIGQWRKIFLETVADYPELGPELYVGTPYFEDTDFKGLIVAGFDPRTVIRFSPNPEELIIIHPGGGVWNSGAEVDEAGILDQPWEELLEDDVTGQVKVGDTYYTWLARFIGEDEYVYATKSVDPDY
ncbi:hypothetical protein [Pseudodesulfovibrio senegalensis]|jgi:hypothetical protein|uniref:Uncharacterized protein n=1 Tax=Pseudodesulfovibrio senegalensis TaxID=1721087 RepID=A0A6N6N2J0_9BACT|nr:hypothetical protein [Pseudodesulfovibrio senegalensis]KAB1441220.1 hypothetical protein F8A88_12380 [Pseudodesulfovibrio senegalensis]